MVRVIITPTWMIIIFYDTIVRRKTPDLLLSGRDLI